MKQTPWLFWWYRINDREKFTPAIRILTPFADRVMDLCVPTAPGNRIRLMMFKLRFDPFKSVPCMGVCRTFNGHEYFLEDRVNGTVFVDTYNGIFAMFYEDENSFDFPEYAWPDVRDRIRLELAVRGIPT